jgi:hypothetical protein
MDFARKSSGLAGAKNLFRRREPDAAIAWRRGRQLRARPALCQAQRPALCQAHSSPAPTGQTQQTNGTTPRPAATEEAMAGIQEATAAKATEAKRGVKSASTRLSPLAGWRSFRRPQSHGCRPPERWAPLRPR